VEQEKDLITVIVPCYNEQETVELFYHEMKCVMDKMGEQEFELVFVNDGSKDETLSIIKQLCMRDNRVKYISFSRNFGKEAAIYAGLEAAHGDYAVLMDADLQDPPKLLPEMYNAVKNENYDSVATRRVTRKGEPVIRSFFARKFYKIMNHISSTDIVDGARDYRLMNRKFVDALLELKEYNRFSKGLFGWVGFKTKWLEYENINRVAGETKWSFWKLFLYSIEGIVAFSTVPLLIAAVTGVAFCVLALLVMLVIFIKTLCFGDPVSGWPSMVCIILFLGGIQLLCIGILGEYLAKIYMEIKDRPKYLIDESNL